MNRWALDDRHLQILQSAGILGVATAILSIMGYVFVLGEYGGYHLNPASLDFPMTAYLMGALIPVIFFGLTIALAFVGSRPDNRSRLGAIRGNTAAWLLVLCLVFFAYTAEDRSTGLFWFIFAAFTLLVMVLESWKRQAISWDVIAGEPRKRMISVVYMAMIVVFLAFALGQVTALMNMRAKAITPLLPAIVFQAKEGSPALPDGPLVLILYRHNNYYVYEDSQALRPQRVYIVPESEISYAVLTGRTVPARAQRQEAASRAMGKRRGQVRR